MAVEAGVPIAINTDAHHLISSNIWILVTKYAQKAWLNKRIL